MQLPIFGIKLLYAHHQVLVGLRQCSGRIGGHFNRAAKRHRDRRRKRNGFLANARQHAQQPVHPAVLDLVRRVAACFQHILAVEVRAIPVGRRDGMEQTCLSRRVQLVQVRKRGMQRERAIQLQRGGRVDRQAASRTGVGRLSVGNDGVQAIGCTALDDEDEAPLSGGLRK